MSRSWLVDALEASTKDSPQKNSDVPETWSPVSTLSNYRTSSVTFPQDVKPNSLLKLRH